MALPIPARAALVSACLLACACLCVGICLGLSVLLPRPLLRRNRVYPVIACVTHADQGEQGGRQLGLKRWGGGGLTDEDEEENEEDGHPGVNHPLVVDVERPAW